MRTAAQCLAMAQEMDRRATAATAAALAAEYRGMAASWRALARQAEWQDSFLPMDDPGAAD